MAEEIEDLCAGLLYRFPWVNSNGKGFKLWIVLKGEGGIFLNLIQKGNVKRV